jgi:hypothetical protein
VSDAFLVVAVGWIIGRARPVRSSYVTLPFARLDANSGQLRRIVYGPSVRVATAHTDVVGVVRRLESLDDVWRYELTAAGLAAFVRQEPRHRAALNSDRITCRPGAKTQ